MNSTPSSESDPAPQADFTVDPHRGAVGVRFCRHCDASASTELPLEVFPHRDGCPLIARGPTLRQLHAEDRIQAYGVVDCEVCRHEMTIGNMVGMGTCGTCGFRRNPMAADFHDQVAAARVAWAGRNRGPRPFCTLNPNCRRTDCRELDRCQLGSRRLSEIRPGDDRRCVDCGNSVIHAPDCPRRDEGRPLGHRVRVADTVAIQEPDAREIFGLDEERHWRPAPDVTPKPHVGIYFPAADRFAEHDRAARRHFTIPRLDPRVRTAPHGDGLDTRTRTPYPCFFSPGGFAGLGAGVRVQEIGERREAAGAAYRAEQERLRGRFDEFAALMNDHPGPFRLHPHQQRFLDMIARGERVIVIPARRSSGWPGVFRIVEEMLRERGRPWFADAQAAENGMGC